MLDFGLKRLISLIEFGVQGTEELAPVLGAVIFVDAGTHDEVDVEAGGIELEEPEKEIRRGIVLADTVLIVVEMVEKLIGHDRFLGLGGIRELRAFDIADGVEVNAIEVDIQRCIRNLEFLAVDCRDFDDVDVSHDV
jgi:hypothetical protein